jgi:hypothetical protein
MSAERRTVRDRGSPVGTHLGVIVVADFVPYGVAGAYGALATIRDSRTRARIDAVVQAGLAPRAITDLLTTTRAQPRRPPPAPASPPCSPAPPPAPSPAEPSLSSPADSLTG